ncbi:MAG: lysoplasmalogenase [Bacteroidota bacterium]
MIHQKNIWQLLFVAVTFLNLYAETIQHIPLIYFSKPLLMVCLGLHFYVNQTKSTPYGQLILVGLFFSFLGDVFLMFRETGDKASVLFLLGLGSFLITQFLYFFAFTRLTRGSGFIRKNWWIGLLFLGFLVGSSIFLLPDLPVAFKLPVLVYSTVITLMVVSCINLYHLIPTTIFRFLLFGVLLFMCSDTLIGLNQFKKEVIQIPFPRIAIMSTYILAQWLIVRGSMDLLGQKKDLLDNCLLSNS